MRLPFQCLVGTRPSTRRIAGVIILVAVVLAAAGCRDDARHEPAASTSAAAAEPTSIRLQPAQGRLADLLPAEATKARARNLKPYVELRADWCGPCRELEASMSDPRMVDAFAGTYVVRVDVDDWAGQLAPLGLDASSIPVFFEVDDQGKPTGRKISGAAWAENIPVNMAPPLKAFFAKK
jgi:thiol:disulfide interchange protein